MKINQPLSLNEQGRRGNQEDNIWPAVGMASESSRTFAVCDGMGGHEAGEVASNAVCTAMGQFVATHPDGPTSPEEAEEAIRGAYEMLDRVDNSDSSKRMGTTLTLLNLTDSKAICCHIGDSRIYQVRPDANGSADIVYKSSDHSLVNELVKARIITPEEALTHPRKNVITRAMQSVEGRRDGATYRETNNVCAGDYFLLCSDGVTEAVRDHDICSILGNNAISNDEKLSQIKQKCLADSHDNFSLYLVPIAEGITASVLFDSTMELAIALPGQAAGHVAVLSTVDNNPAPEAVEPEIITIPSPSTDVCSQVLEPASEVLTPAPAPVSDKAMERSTPANLEMDYASPGKNPCCPPSDEFSRPERPVNPRMSMPAAYDPGEQSYDRRNNPWRKAIIGAITLIVCFILGFIVYKVLEPEPTASPAIEYDETKPDLDSVDEKKKQTSPKSGESDKASKAGRSGSSKQSGDNARGKSESSKETPVVRSQTNDNQALTQPPSNVFTQTGSENKVTTGGKDTGRKSSDNKPITGEIGQDPKHFKSSSSVNGNNTPDGEDVTGNGRKQ